MCSALDILKCINSFFHFLWVYFVWNNDVYQPNKILMCTIYYTLIYHLNPADHGMF